VRPGIHLGFKKRKMGSMYPENVPDSNAAVKTAPLRRIGMPEGLSSIDQD
jgi:hypothetical protein